MAQIDTFVRGITQSQANAIDKAQKLVVIEIFPLINNSTTGSSFTRAGLGIWRGEQNNPSELTRKTDFFSVGKVESIGMVEEVRLFDLTNGLVVQNSLISVDQTTEKIYIAKDVTLPKNNIIIEVQFRRAVGTGVKTVSLFDANVISTFE